MKENKKKWPIVLILLIMCVIIAIVPLFIINDSEFGGADGKAEELIETISPEYSPWADSIVELPGGETESLLFCLQAALGGGLLGYGFGFFKARKKYSTDEK
jgi:ABC-type cobalt transport system, periplasmic component